MLTQRACKCSAAQRPSLAALPLLHNTLPAWPGKHTAVCHVRSQETNIADTRYQRARKNRKKHQILTACLLEVLPLVP